MRSFTRQAAFATPQAELVGALSPLGFVDWLGRRLIMDFGFGAFLEKFEEYFGKRLTKVLVALIAVSTATFCLSLLVNNLWIPLYELVTGIEVHKPGWWLGGVIGFNIIALAITISALSILSKNTIRSTIMLKEANEALEGAKESLKDAELVVEKAKEANREAELVLEKAKDYTLRENQRS